MSKLTELQIEEVSLTAQGKNPEALVTLFKAKTAPKASSVAQLEKLVQSLATRLDEQINKAKDAQFLAVAQKYEVLGTPAQELATLLKSVQKASPAAYDSAIKALDVSMNALTKAGLFEEIGKSGEGIKPTAQEQIKRAVAQIKEKNPTISEREALDLAYLAHPELQY